MGTVTVRRRRRNYNRLEDMAVAKTLSMNGISELNFKSTYGKALARGSKGPESITFWMVDVNAERMKANGDLFTLKKVTVFQNGTNTNGKIFAVDPMWVSTRPLSFQVSQRFGIVTLGDPLIFYTTEGLEIDHCGLMGNSETFYFAMQNEEFIQPGRAGSKNLSDTQVKVNSIIKLNVGGVLFETMLGTLLNDPKSKLAKMFDPNSGEQTPPLDRVGSYFLDRDPRYFAPLLNYLRTGRIILDAGLNLEGVLEEAAFFGIRICITGALDE